MRRMISSMNVFAGESLQSESDYEITNIGQQNEKLVFCCQLRLIFKNKDNSESVRTIRESLLKDEFLKAAEEHHFSILDISYTYNDVTLLIGYDPEYSISQCITELKKAAARISFSHLIAESIE